MLLLVQPGLLLLILWFDLPSFGIIFSAVHHVKQAYNTPQGCYKYRHAGWRQSSNPRNALESCTCWWRRALDHGPRLRWPWPGQRANPGAREQNRNGYSAAFGRTRARAGGCGGELGYRAGGSQQIVSSIPEDAEPLNRISHHKASFNEISNKFSRFRITHYSVVRGRMLVLAGVINRDIGVWESDLSTFVRDTYSGTMPPGASTVIEVFPLPDWKGMTYFINGGRVLLAMQPLSLVPAPAPSSTPSGGVDSNKRPAANGPCFMFLQHGYCRVKRCIRYRHDPADLAAPEAGRTGDHRHGWASSGIAKPTAGGTGGNGNALGGQRNGLDGTRNGSNGTRNGSTSRVANTGTDGSSGNCCMAWQPWRQRRPRWHRRGRRQQRWRRYC